MLEVKVIDCSFLINFDVFTFIIGFEAYSPDVGAEYE